MQRDYVVYPSMIDGESGVMWFYDNPSVVAPFDDSHPIDVSAAKCNDMAICLWYTSPLWQFTDPLRTKYALLGEYNKWTPVSQQRFVAIGNNDQQTEATVTLQGAPSEIVPVAVYHSALQTVLLDCPISSANGQANLVITPTTVVCS